MEIRTCKIIRRSIYTFLKKYQYFTSAAFLALPFSASILLSQTITPSLSILPVIQFRLQSLFYAAGFPPSSAFFSILILKLSQTITSSILVLPFTLSFLLIAKATIIQSFNREKNSSFYSFLSLFNSLFVTQLWNSFILLSANATCFWITFIGFNCMENLFPSISPTSSLIFSGIAALLYSIILANALVVCNLALILSGMEKNGGFISILKACVLIKGRTSTALSLALPINFALAAIEALFQYRIVKANSSISPLANSSISPLALEGMFIAYLYSVLVVLDTIISCVFFKRCEVASYAIRFGEESRYVYRLEIKQEDDEEDGRSRVSSVKVMSLEELP